MIDTTKTVYSSNIPIDRIIGTYSDSFSSAAPAQGTTSSDSQDKTTNITETTLYTGIYSVDGGTTWYAFDDEIKHLDNNGSIFVRGESRSGTFKIISSNSRNPATGTGPAYTVQYHVALIAKPDQGDITPQPIGSDTYFDSRLNYQKISLDDAQNVSSGFTVTQSHNALGIPRARVWFETSGVLKQKGFYSSAIVSMTATDIIVDFSAYALAGRLYTRTYYHEQ